jgi:RNA polymerase sigma factor (sigma-70 family)
MMLNSSRATYQDPPQELWQAFQAGDKQAFAQLYEQYFNLLHDYGMKLTGEEEATLDCIQDFFLYIWNQREKLSAVNSLRFYLFTSFRRRLFKYLEKKRNQEYRQENYQGFQPDMAFSAEKRIILSEQESIQVELVRKLMEELSPRQKEVLYLRYYAGLSPREISDIISVNYQTVVNHFYEAFKTLRKQKPTIIKTLMG